MYVERASKASSISNIHGRHSQRFLKFPDFLLTNIKFPRPTELTVSQISPNDGLHPLLTQPSSPPIYLCFQQVTCNVPESIVPSDIMQMELIFLKTQHQRNVQFHEQFSINTT